jgi:hypothetical protein
MSQVVHRRREYPQGLALSKQRSTQHSGAPPFPGVSRNEELGWGRGTIFAGIDDLKNELGGSDISRTLTDLQNASAKRPVLVLYS